MLLALDTSSERVTVAVADPVTGEPLAAYTARPGLRHAEQLAPVIAGVLAEANLTPPDLTRIAVGVGPGPFTGLRVGLVTAVVLGAALDIEVNGYCSLDVIATTYAGGPEAPERFVVATDARRKEVYWAAYTDGARVAGPHVERPAELADRLSGRPPGAKAGDTAPDGRPDITGWPVVGAGARLYPDALGGSAAAADDLLVDAAVLARAAAAGDLPALEPAPLYLRRPDVHRSAGRKSVL